ncbi:hypothetical protein LINPERPRIM_LOCUS1035 [Linum perenne]
MTAEFYVMPYRALVVYEFHMGTTTCVTLGI